MPLRHKLRRQAGGGRSWKGASEVIWTHRDTRSAKKLLLHEDPSHLQGNEKARDNWRRLQSLKMWYSLNQI